MTSPTDEDRAVQSTTGANRWSVYASHALQGMLAGHIGIGTFDGLAAEAGYYADAMMAEECKRFGGGA